ncbi:MAG: hypothetical protein IT327_08450 [Anaerolineae bacterium]|nr:hypothetical protein [Anaerolineae bacterium]
MFFYNSAYRWHIGWAIWRQWGGDWWGTAVSTITFQATRDGRSNACFSRA